MDELFFSLKLEKEEEAELSEFIPQCPLNSSYNLPSTRVREKSKGGKAKH